MSNFSNWSNDSQTHTQICILESQVEVKQTQIGDLKEKCNLLELEKLQLKDEIDRLNELVRTITVGPTTNFNDRASFLMELKDRKEL